MKKQQLDLIELSWSLFNKFKIPSKTDNNSTLKFVLIYYLQNNTLLNIIVKPKNC